MDDAHSGLESCADSLYYPVRRPDDAALISTPFTQNSGHPLYDSGQGVSQDHLEAAAWYRKAAEQGYAKALTNLGFLYSRGQGVPQDYTLAYMLYSLGATAGDEQGRKNLESITKILDSSQVIEGEALIVAWELGTSLPTRSQTGR